MILTFTPRNKPDGRTTINKININNENLATDTRLINIIIDSKSHKLKKRRKIAINLLNKKSQPFTLTPALLA